MSWLVDTSVWIDHFRSGNVRLATLLGEDAVLVHPVVIGELACGNFRHRSAALESLQLLPRAPEVSFSELLDFIERHRLHGRGIGWSDVQLLASARLAGAALWTQDRRLHRAALRL